MNCLHSGTDCDHIAITLLFGDLLRVLIYDFVHECEIILTFVPFVTTFICHIMDFSLFAIGSLLLYHDSPYRAIIFV